MLISPIENTAKSNELDCKQFRPNITQLFGKDLLTYNKFGLNGHNGIDLQTKINTPIFAPCNGEIRVKNSFEDGYGLHVKIRNLHGSCEIILAHFSKVVVENYDLVELGDFLGFARDDKRNSHLHLGLRFLLPKKRIDIFGWRVRDYNNGFFGYVDPLSGLITFKGGFRRTSLMEGV
jgi:murein DD-endopeptidase MepM/ murein hydrolase activator NlpD